MFFFLEQVCVSKKGQKNKMFSFKTESNKEENKRNVLLFDGYQTKKPVHYKQ